MYVLTDFQPESCSSWAIPNQSLPDYLPILNQLLNLIFENWQFLTVMSSDINELDLIRCLHW